MRGEDDDFEDAHVEEDGSPPHARGRLRHDGRPYAAFRITPACAGKTAKVRDARMLPPDHPRMRGEDVDAVVTDPPYGRITPACAGKTDEREVLFFAFEDHPRMRGEDRQVFEKLLASVGSPPHARGRLIVSPYESADERITPACAGKTHILSVGCAASRDHPRMRGEDDTVRRVVSISIGSPPHARGRRRPHVNRRRSTRITPACAGKTQKGFDGIRHH